MSSNQLTATPTIAKRIIKNQAMFHMKRALAGERVRNLPICLHSSPGVGKSAITSQASHELSRELFPDGNQKVGFVDVRLGCYEASDVQGIPYVSQTQEEDGKLTRQDMLFSVPKWWPRDPDSVGILFFDELLNADISTQHAAYQIIHDRAIHDLKLPDGWVIIAAGNKLEDKTGSKKLAPALANRFGSHIYLDVSVDSWMDFAAKAQIHPEVIAFLNFRTDLLFKFDPKNKNPAFPTPRSWEAASNHLHCADIMNYDGADADLNLLLSGCVGDGTATEFMGFRRFFNHLPDFEKIMNGKQDYRVPSETSDKQGIMYALVSSLFHHTLENYEESDRLKNLAKVIRQLPDEFGILFFRFVNKAELKVKMNVFEVLEDRFEELEAHLG